RRGRRIATQHDLAHLVDHEPHLGARREPQPRPHALGQGDLAVCAQRCAHLRFLNYIHAGPRRGSTLRRSARSGNSAALFRKPRMSGKDSFRPKARRPRGFMDRRGPRLVAERALIANISKVYEAWGFEPLETSAFEFADALGKFLPDQDRPNEGVFALTDD